MKTAVGYIRVSTVNQLSLDAYGLIVQKEAIEKYCQDNEITLWEIFSDEAVSGTCAPAKRPGMSALMTSVTSKKPDMVIVPKFDRLARDVYYHLTLEREFERRKIDLVSVQEGRCKDDPQAQLQKNIFAVFAQYELGIITSRLKAGRAAKRARGGYPGGSIPFGFDLVDDMLVVNPDERQTMLKILGMHEEGQSLSAIARALNDKGKTTKTGKKWYPMQVSRVVNNIQRII